MHVVTWTYPDAADAETRKRVFTFLHALADVIPCMRCRVDWKDYLAKNVPAESSPHLDSRASLTKFIVDGHNYVNRKLGKREYTYDEARSLYEPNVAVTTRGYGFNAQTLALVLIVGLLVLYQVGVRSWARSVPCRAEACGGRAAPGGD